MEEKKYKVEEVLLGFREEYLKIQSELKELKKSTLCFDKRVNDFNFFLTSQLEYQNPELFCRFDVKENAFKKALADFLLQFGWDIKVYGKDETQVLRDFNNRYLLTGFYHAQVEYGSIFHEQVEKIMKSDFVKFFLDDEPISFADSSIHLYGDWLRFALQGIGSLSYDASSDSLSLSTFNDDIILPEVLDYPIPYKTFQLYHRNVISRYRNSAKGVIVEDFASSSKNTKYQIEEDEKTIILRRTK